MNDIKLYARLSSAFPIIWLVTFFITLLIGTFSFGHIPIYGVDPDPHSLDSLMINSLQIINLISICICFLAVPGWLLLYTHLLINKVKLTRLDIILLVSVLLSLIFFLLFNLVWTSQFLWHND